MLDSYVSKPEPEKDELEARLDAAGARLEMQQLRMKDRKLPVLVLVDGWETSGKGYAIGRIIQNLDPRFYKVYPMEKRSDIDYRKPFLCRHFSNIPKEGNFSFIDTGWASEIVSDYLHEEISKKEALARLESVRNFERTLRDNGYLIVKMFLNISKKEQDSRIDMLRDDKDTAWRVDDNDLWQHENYDKFKEAYSACLAQTDLPFAPWHIIDAKSRKWTELQALEILTQAIDTAFENGRQDAPILQSIFPLKPMPLLKDIPLDKSLTDEQYKEDLKRLREKLFDLSNRLYRKKVPVIIGYEGWDAAGKGGNIKRLTSALDPLDFEVHPIASPTTEEKSRHFLWRFWTRLPKTGHIAIFDRTWYGRVMVERLEGYCSENDWKRAYYEMNEFEKELYDWGAVIIKFWVQIDKDTQLQRFNDRQNTPEKQWKITDEDWRNREKWDLYEGAVDEMIAKTSTTYAPWYILESVDKKYARIKAMKILTIELEKRLGLDVDEKID